MDHDIFTTPNPVDLTIEERSTPGDYARYMTEATMPMWRVQTEGYTEGTGQLVGVVSRDSGFLDSPDAEYIASGVNSKNPHAIALGRHGNFFHWGFAASPTYMTAEAKLVFINAVHYIARFDRQGLIARKKQGVMMREALVAALDSMSDARYAETVKLYEGIAREDRERKAAIQVKIDAGEDVTEIEKRQLRFPPTQVPGRFDRIKRYVSDDVWAEVGGDQAAIRAHVEANLPYVRPVGWYGIEVDAELKELGVGNGDPRFLERVIAVAARGDAGSPLALKLLARYTAESFATGAEWLRWHAQNEHRMFFSEAAGYKWLVNRRAAEARSGPVISDAPTREPTKVLKPTARKPAAARCEIRPLGASRFAVTVDVSLFAGWHAYGAAPAGSPYAVMKPELVLPEGMKQEGDWERPDAHPDPLDPSLAVYEGTFAFRTIVAGGDAQAAAAIACKLSYQVCDETMCRPPTVDVLDVVVVSESAETVGAAGPSTTGVTR